jgi:hypothetical protein
MPIKLVFNLGFKLKLGDWAVFALGMGVVIWLFMALWSNEPAGKVRIRSGNQIYATLSLNQQRTLEIPGALGVSRIVINNGQVRFEESPCRNQYCVHQGWLHKTGQVAICLPNHVSVELLGTKSYDSLNY